MDPYKRLLEIGGRDLAGNPVWAWALAGVVALSSLLALLAAKRMLVARLKTRAEGGGGLLVRFSAELFSRTYGGTLVSLAILAGSLCLHVPTRIQSALQSLVVILVLVQAGLWANALVWSWLQHRLREQPDTARSTAVLMLSFGGKLLIWTAVLLLSLDNIGLDVTALIAGLGVGGIAVALAVQNVLGDLLGSIAIALDKPFELGDFIVVGDLAGTVEHIGLKTTRVRSLSGEQIVFSNADLLGSRVRNFKRMRSRRVVFSIGVTYQTPPETLERIPAILREIIEARKDVRFDRAHFHRYGEFALLFETVFHVESADYNLYMDRQQEVNLEISRRFAAEGIRFAYPTQKIFVEQVASA
jgi:small-conductance mechanosensitive channel